MGLSCFFIVTDPWSFIRDWGQRLAHFVVWMECLTSHLLAHNLGCFKILAVRNSAATNTSRFLWERKFLSLE